jgi:hypothetical protein
MHVKYTLKFLLAISRASAFHVSLAKIIGFGVLSKIKNTIFVNELKENRLQSFLMHVH